MGKINKKKPEKEDAGSISGVSHHSNNISTPLRRSTRQSVHMSSSKAKVLSASATPVKTELENKDVFASPRQPLKQKSARKEKVLQTVNREASLLDESMPESIVTPMKPTESSAVKKARGRPKSARKTLEVTSILDESMPAMVESPSQPDKNQLVVVANTSSAVKSEHSRAKSMIKILAMPQEPESTVEVMVNVNSAANSDEKIAIETNIVEPEAKEELKELAKPIQSRRSKLEMTDPTKPKLDIAEETLNKSGSAKRKPARTANRPSKVFKIEMSLDEEDQAKNKLSLKPDNETTEDVLAIIKAGFANFENPGEPPIKGHHEHTPESVEVENPVVILPKDPIEATVTEESKAEDGVGFEDGHLTETMEESVITESKDEEIGEFMELATVQPEISEVLEPEPEQNLDTTFEMITNDQYSSDEQDETRESENKCLTIDLIDVASPVVPESAEKPQQRPKKLNTIDLVTPGTEKRPKSINEQDQETATVTAKKVIEIADTPEPIQSHPLAETSILKNMSGGTKARMTRATFFNGCNDSIFIHAEQLELKSCRKRSQSFCVDEADKSVRKANRVQFYSPLNMEIDIATIDNRLQQSFIESNAGKRRKRSMSVPNMGNDGSGAKKISMRTKIPNFNAIHEQNFKKMESISEHLERKAERSKRILELSKSPVGSVKKTTGKPAPLQLSKSAVIAVPVAHVAPISKIAAPKAKLNTSVAPEKPKAAVFAAVQPRTEPISTAPLAKTNVTISKTTDLKNVSAVNTSMASRSFATNRDKTAQRLQSYKRMDGGGNNEANKVKRVAAIKGVRSNRRFELQMQFRERETQGE